MHVDKQTEPDDGEDGSADIWCLLNHHNMYHFPVKRTIARRPQRYLLLWGGAAPFLIFIVGRDEEEEEDSGPKDQNGDIYILKKTTKEEKE